MKKIFAFIFFVQIVFFAISSPIDPITAKKVGFNFLKTRTQLNVSTLSASNLSLVYKSDGQQVFQSGSPIVTTYFYIFNLDTDNGFVIVSGDDIAIPVLGYSTVNKFDSSKIPINTFEWFEGYRMVIRYALDNNLSSSIDNTNNWQSLINPNNSTIGTTTLGTPILPPLIKTQWSQGIYYNDLCPFDNIKNERTVTGCVATAMAQILKYWNYPLTGNSYNAYYLPQYGTLSVNFGASNYQWASMPNMVFSPNNAVAKLMYDCGVSVNMAYNTASSGGSGAYVISSTSPFQNCTEYALKNYFGYKASLQGISRNFFWGGGQWLSMLKTELNANRPIIYAGSNYSVGHCFVADGYDNNNFLHFNWGWGGNGPDGYYSIDVMAPPILGIGGGSGGGYRFNQEAIIGIEPATYYQSLVLTLNDSAILSSSNIAYKDPFTIKTSIINAGMTNFSGDFAAKVFDTLNNFIGDVEIKTGKNLLVGDSTNTLIFSTTGLPSLIPNTYIVGIFYRPVGGQWSLVSSNSKYTNFPAIKVTNNNPIALNSAINVTPSPIIKGQSIVVNFDIINLSNATFYGKYYVGLYNLDGSLAQMIDSVSETIGLSAGSSYSNTFQSFSTVAVTVNTGKYLLIGSYCAIGGTLQLLGANLFQNPFNVLVGSSGVKPDAYEVNNTPAKASLLPVTFTGSLATISTLGSNCHLGNDYDYYKIVLPSGFNYQIKPRLKDIYSQNIGNTYSLDAAFSYSFDSINWSQSYDVTINSFITLNNGGIIYFKVLPHYLGNIGTYLFEMNISRAIVTPVTLISFTGKYNNNKKNITLNWHTVTETNMDKYIVEKSIGANKYTALGSVKANNYSLYQFTDENPNKGGNYYRLQMLDNDGKIGFSNIVFVLLENNNSVTVFPNPTKDIVTINSKGKKRLTITDCFGRIIKQLNGINENQIIDTKGWSKGIYIFSFDNETNIKVVKE